MLHPKAGPAFSPKKKKQPQNMKKKPNRLQCAHLLAQPDPFFPHWLSKMPHPEENRSTSWWVTVLSPFPGAAAGLRATPPPPPKTPHSSPLPYFQEEENFRTMSITFGTTINGPTSSYCSLIKQTGLFLCRRCVCICHTPFLLNPPLEIKLKNPIL